ncbi:MAG: SbcC/MukB-like Walker B domain-containing protein, partial [Nitriliruptoraceae bacterium]
DARRVELVTLQERMGADVQAVLAALGAVEDDLRAAETERSAAEARIRTAAAARGQAEGEVGAADEARISSGERVVAAHRRLAVLARSDLAGPLDLDVGDDVDEDALLEAVDALVTGVSGAGERRKAAQTRITRSLEELDHALGSGYRPSWDVEDDLIVVTIADELGERSVAAFAAELSGQRTDQEALLTARERAVFEDALLTSVCGQIHHRTQATRDLVTTMDAQMRARRLSSGHTVGVAWRAEDSATAAWKRVHRLLDQDPAHFGPDQLEELRRHFSAEIKAARAAHPQTPYRELLAEVLDYRRWRRFELFLVEADGSEALLTRARHARLSGGEKAASLHLPLFAAAHAAFAAGSPTCPRLLALDEAFAGIDDQGRSELLSLSVAFDLDLFMTGFDLWAVDRAVPGVAHYDLLHLADEHAVSSLLILWNGTELVEGPDAEVAVARGWTLT